MASNTFVTLAVALGDGVGASVDISGLAVAKTVTVAGSFGGAVQVEVSDDDVLYVPVTELCAAACVQTLAIAASFARVRSFKRRTYRRSSSRASG